MSVSLSPLTIVKAELISPGVIPLPSVSCVLSGITLDSVSIGADTFSRSGTDGNSKGLEANTEKWLEIRTVTPGLMVYGKPGFWTEGPPGEWSPPAGAWTVYSGNTFTSVTPPPGKNFVVSGSNMLLDFADLWTGDPGSLEVAGSDHATISYLGGLPMPSWGVNPFPLTAPAYSAWTPVGGGILGTVLATAFTGADSFNIESRLNIPVGASSSGDFLFNLELFLKG